MNRRFPIFLLLAFFAQSIFAAPKVEVSGILLTRKGQTAIINGKCYAVNDTLAGGRITAIEKGCVTVQVKNETWKFPVGGKAEVSSAKKKPLAEFMKRTKDRMEARRNKSH